MIENDFDLNEISKLNFSCFLLDSLKDELLDITANVPFPYFALHIDSLAV